MTWAIAAIATWLIGIYPAAVLNRRHGFDPDTIGFPVCWPLFGMAALLAWPLIRVARAFHEEQGG